MNKKTRMVLSICLYFIFVVLLTIYLMAELDTKIIMNIYVRLALLVLLCVCWYNAGRLYASCFGQKQANKIMRVTFFVLFVLYVALLLTLTLFDKFFGRSGLSAFEWDKELFIDYLEESFNFLPFATITLYFKAVFNGDITFEVFAVNIFGNILAFAPFGLFLPLLSKKMRRYRNFIFLVLAATVFIELMQFVFLTGSCDIDDVLLNSLGASLAFVFFNSKAQRARFDRLMYEEMQD